MREKGGPRRSEREADGEYYEMTNTQARWRRRHYLKTPQRQWLLTSRTTELKYNKLTAVTSGDVATAIEHLE